MGTVEIDPNSNSDPIRPGCYSLSSQVGSGSKSDFLGSGSGCSGSRPSIILKTYEVEWKI